MLISRPQPLKALTPIVATLNGIAALVKLRQKPNASLPILVTLFGIVTALKLVTGLNFLDH